MVIWFILWHYLDTACLLFICFLLLLFLFWCLFVCFLVSMPVQTHSHRVCHSFLILNSHDDIFKPGLAREKISRFVSNSKYIVRAGPTLYAKISLAEPKVIISHCRNHVVPLFLNFNFQNFLAVSKWLESSQTKFIFFYLESNTLSLRTMWLIAK